MDYYIVVNGEKQGPFDVLGLIKKAKNGMVTPETQVSANPSGPFVPAVEVPELHGIFRTEGHPEPQGNTNLNFKNIFSDGIELWMRRVVGYTLFLGAIMILGFFLLIGLRRIQVVADYSYIADYVTGLVTVTLLGLFYYYVLMTKRSQELDKREINAVATRSLPHLFIYAAVFSLAAVTYGISGLAALLTTVAVFFAASFLAFAPFLIVDHRMPVGRAVKVSVETMKNLSAQSLGVVLALVSINIAIAVIFGFISGNLVIFGLMVTLPITISTLAYIYDQILA